MRRRRSFGHQSGDLLQSYSEAAGIETASLLSFDFGNQDGPVTSALPPGFPEALLASTINGINDRLALVRACRDHSRGM